MSLFILQRVTLVGVLFGFVFAALPLLVSAQLSTPSGTPFQGSTPTGGYPLSTPTGTTVKSPLQVTSICGLLKKLYEAEVAIGIPVAVLFIVWAGFKFVLAQGNPKQLEKAKWNFFYTVIGIGIFLGTWVIVMVMAAT